MTGPIETKCAECGRVAAETVCSLCKTPRQGFVKVKDFFAELFLETERRENNYANDRNKADRENPPYDRDGDYTVFGGRLRPGQ